MFSMSTEEQKKLEDAFATTSNLAEADVKLIGDRTTICQVVQFLAYVRHAIRNNLKAEIKVKVGSNVANGQLLFDVNGLEIPDLITQENIEIN